MKAFLCTAVLAASTLSAVPVLAASSQADLKQRLDSAAQVVKEIETVPDGGIPDAIIGKAECVAVIPSVKKAAFVVGGSYGQGVATCHKNGKWTAPVFIRLAGGSFGFQIGAQATDLVMVAVNQKGLEDLLHSKFKIGADASAAAGPVGRHAAVGTDILLNAELLTYSRAKGLFAGIDLNGATVSQNDDDTKAFYNGQTVTTTDVLGGKVPAPADAQPFLAAMTQYLKSAR